MAMVGPPRKTQRKTLQQSQIGLLFLGSPVATCVFLGTTLEDSGKPFPAMPQFTLEALGQKVCSQSPQAVLISCEWFFRGFAPPFFFFFFFLKQAKSQPAAAWGQCLAG